MKKRIVITVLVVSLVSVGVFAGSMKYRKTRNISSVRRQIDSSMYIKVDDSTYKNVETNEIFTLDSLPRNFRVRDKNETPHNRAANHKSFNNRERRSNRNNHNQRLDYSNDLKDDFKIRNYQKTDLNSSSQ